MDDGALMKLKSRLSFSLVADYLSTQRRNEDDQVSREAKQTLHDFVHALLVAVAKESWRRFYSSNGRLQNPSNLTKRRLPWGVVRRAINEVLENPEKHLQDWVRDERDDDSRSPRAR